jgi:hypothetical protein
VYFNLNYTFQWLLFSTILVKIILFLFWHFLGYGSNICYSFGSYKELLVIIWTYKSIPSLLSTSCIWISKFKAFRLSPLIQLKESEVIIMTNVNIRWRILIISCKYCAAHSQMLKQILQELYHISFPYILICTCLQFIYSLGCLVDMKLQAVPLAFLHFCICIQHLCT